MSTAVNHPVWGTAPLFSYTQNITGRHRWEMLGAKGESNQIEFAKTSRIPGLSEIAKIPRGRSMIFGDYRSTLFSQEIGTSFDITPHSSNSFYLILHMVPQFTPKSSGLVVNRRLSNREPQALYSRAKRGLTVQPLESQKC